MDNIDRYKKTFSKITKKDDLNNFHYGSVDNKKIQRSNYNNIRIGHLMYLVEVWNIIVIKTFHDYLKDESTANVSICTTGPQKYKDLGLKNTKFNHMVRKDGSTWDDGECSGYHELKLVNKSVKFDIMIVIHIINYVFNIKKIQKINTICKRI